MAVSEEIQRQVLEEATSATPNYTVDMNGEQFKAVDAAVENSWNEYSQTVGGMIGDTDKYYDDQIQATQKWEDEQKQLQQDRTDFTIEQIEQEMDKAHKDYLKEQSASYVDWQKQSNQYGTQAEKMASAGLTNTGFSESSQVSMYNTYQNRVATARESYNNAVLNYKNAIKDAQIQNSAALAEIAYQSLQQQLELSLQGFQYKNQLITDLASKKIEFENTRWNRYQDVLQQINTENALAENIRQFNENQKWQTEQKALDRQHAVEIENLRHDFDKKMAEIDHDYDVKLEGVKSANKKAELEKEYALRKQEAEEELQRQIELKNKELENQKSLIRFQESLSTTSNPQSLNGKPTSQYNYTPVSGKPTSFTGSTLSEAQSYVISQGVPQNMVSGIYSASEWSRRKTGNSTATVIKESNSYQEYLKLQTQYLIDEYGNGRSRGDGRKF